MKKSHLIVVSAGLFAAAPAFAAGLPQLDNTWFSNQLLWLAVSFLALYAVISSFVAPTISKVLDTRAEQIAAAIRDAEEAKRMAETTRSSFESEGQSARTKAAELLAKVQGEISRDATEAMNKLGHDLSRKAEQADARIEDAKAKAFASMHTATVSLTKAMTEKLLGHSVSDATVEQSVNRYMKAAPQKEAA